MSKRRLSKQQMRRIKRRQSAQLVSAGMENRSSRPPRDYQESPEVDVDATPSQGRVIARFRDQANIRASDGGVLRCHLRSNLDSVVVGDWALYQVTKDGAVVTAVEERSNELSRPGSVGELKVLAANITQVLIVLAPKPKPYANMLDRYLVATELLGARAIVVLNKTDMPEARTTDVDELLEPYEPLGYSVLRTSGTQNDVEALAVKLEQQTSILVGQSGVGKTTLLNALVASADERTGQLSRERAKGRHTTTTARLFELENGGSLIDSPGIREFGLQHLSQSDVEAGFREFRSVIKPCRFRDCTHMNEPGCGFRAAIAQSAIHPSRAASFLHILESTRR
ncbi:MAG: ribosome small subunit-dependent GTPase A [Pseudomonadota bacterium]